MKNWRRLLPILTCLIMTGSLLFSGLFGGVSNADAGPPVPGEGNYQIKPIPPGASQADAVSAPGRKRGKIPRLDTALAIVSAAAERSVAQALDLAAGKSLRLAGDQVLVQVTVGPGEAGEAARLVGATGGEVTGRSADGKIIQAWLPVQGIRPLAAEQTVLFIRQPVPAIPLEDVAAGSFETEALSVMNASAWHSAGYDGTGVKVGVVDAGFMGYASLLGTELPTSVIVRNFVDGESDAEVNGTTEHGTACAEIVHDVAPGAQLFLVKVGTDIDLQEAVSWLTSQGVDVITTSLGWYNVTPGDGTGPFADLVGNARSAGIFWSTAAGNDRQAHWGGQYADGGGAFHDFDGGGQVVDYFGPGNGDAYYIPNGELIRVYLRWDDWTDVDQDYDLYLYQWDENTANWREVAFSEDYQDGSPGQTPTEQMSYYTADEYGTSDGQGFYGILVQRYYSDRDINLELFAPKVDRLDEIVTARSLSNLADAPDAVTVAALDVSSPYPQEYYSSEGPTNGPGGAAGGGAIKPDISAFAQVTTQSYGAGGFAGTSAATPHIAGAAALVLDMCPTCTPNQVEALLDYRAIDMGSTGLDTQFGNGRLFLGDPALYSDVPSSYWASDWIEALRQSGITSGCGSLPPMYCPEDSVTRAQMAVFLERGMRGSGYAPDPASGAVFSDVDASYWAAAWIEALANDGITAGCGQGNYCPEAAVTRAQMAIFIERAMRGSGYAPDPASGALFADVDAGYWAVDWIEQLYSDGITGGCSASPPLYCPEATVTRAQMAVFLVRAFGFPIP